ncbi:unnamed protein product [Rotaria sp. Silwood1]|nr:unnamed protein product [Rotaria sp. Silwood1]
MEVKVRPSHLKYMIKIMTVDTAAVPENKKTNPSITKRDRRDVIRQVREITGLDDNFINQTIEACKDSTGRYSLEQVINLLFDDNLRNNLQQSTHNNQNQNQSHPNPNASVQATATPLSPPTSDRNHGDTITDDVIEISPENDNQQTIDDDLERHIIFIFQSFKNNKQLHGENHINGNNIQLKYLIYPPMLIDSKQQKLLTYMPCRDEYQREYLNQPENRLPILNNDQ